MIGPVRRILPVPGPGDDGSVDLEMLYQVPRERVGDRPWVGLCMIASLDGSIAVDGISGRLGNADDAAVLTTLRHAADSIIIGARNAVAEAYHAATKPKQRIGVVT